MMTRLGLYSANVFLVGLNVDHCFSQAIRDGRVELLPLLAFAVTTLTALLTYPGARREVHL